MAKDKQLDQSISKGLKTTEFMNLMLETINNRFIRMEKRITELEKEKKITGDEYQKLAVKMEGKMEETQLEDGEKNE